jgi:hypothetical protein
MAVPQNLVSQVTQGLGVVAVLTTRDAQLVAAASTAGGLHFEVT